MYQRRYSSLWGNGQQEGQRRQSYTPRDNTPPATSLPVIRISGPATALQRLRQALLEQQPNLEGRIGELHSAFSARHITLREYWEGLQELRRDYGGK